MRKAAASPKTIAIAARKMYPQHNQSHTDCLGLPGGFGTRAVCFTRGAGRKASKKTWDREDKMPPDVIAKGTSFTTAIDRENRIELYVGIKAEPVSLIGLLQG